MNNSKLTDRSEDFGLSRPVRKSRNGLLAALPEIEYLAIAKFFEAVVMPARFVIGTRGQHIDYLYFPNSGIGSIVASSPDGDQAESGIFGRDGFAPVSALMGVDVCSFDIFMQSSGEGVRIKIEHLPQVLAASPQLHQLMTRYVHTLYVQTTFTALTNAIHHIEERLARWLLMCHDRSDGAEITLTHDFLSLMLAVRRPSVTTALHVLEGNRFITARRGRVSIRDRRALEDFAADAYGAPEDEYRRVIGSISLGA